MLDIKFIRENAEALKIAVDQKGEGLDVELLLSVDRDLLAIKKNEQELLTQRKSHSKKIPKASNEERPVLIEQGREIGKQIDELKPEVQKLESQFKELMFLVPSIPHPDTPVGKDESGNVEIIKHGDIPKFSFKPLDHVQILEKQNWAEFEVVADICGSRSYSLRNEMVLLEMSMHRFALDKLMKKGFTLATAPSLVREHALVATGHFPKGRDQVYQLPDDDLFLSGTAEVQLNSFHSGQILTEDQLPILYAGFSPCFRREAGSYGRDVRGLIRVHQFMKVEQYIICKNSVEESEKWHKTLLETSEEIVKELELPYRVIECCTGDMGTGKVRMYDIECWVPSEQLYRETHSCSSLHDWQARRSNTRYRDSEGKVKHVFTLNNTAIATPRIMVPFLENHQTEDGRVRVPEALRPYLGGSEFLGKAF